MRIVFIIIMLLLSYHTFCEKTIILDDQVSDLKKISYSIIDITYFSSVMDSLENNFLSARRILTEKNTELPHDIFIKNYLLSVSYMSLDKQDNEISVDFMVKAYTSLLETVNDEREEIAKFLTEEVLTFVYEMTEHYFQNPHPIKMNNCFETWLKIFEYQAKICQELSDTIYAGLFAMRLLEQGGIKRFIGVTREKSKLEKMVIIKEIINDVYYKNIEGIDKLHPDY